MPWTRLCPIGGNFSGMGFSHLPSANIACGFFFSQRSALRICWADSPIARLYQRFHASSKGASGHAICLSLNISTSSPQITRRSHSSLPAFLNTLGQDQRSRNVSSASLARCFSVGVRPEAFFTDEMVVTLEPLLVDRIGAPCRNSKRSLEVRPRAPEYPPSRH